MMNLCEKKIQAIFQDANSHVPDDELAEEEDLGSIKKIFESMKIRFSVSFCFKSNLSQKSLPIHSF